jgi:hypothetical protein
MFNHHLQAALILTCHDALLGAHRGQHESAPAALGKVEDDAPAVAEEVPHR